MMPYIKPESDLLANFMTEAEFAGEIGKCVATVQRWRLRGKGPAYTMIGRTPLIARATAHDWLASCAKGLTDA